MRITSTTMSRMRKNINRRRMTNTTTLKALKLKYASPSSFFLVASTAQGLNAIKLYLHVGGTTLKAKWIVSEKIAYSFFKTSNVDDDPEYDDDKK
ncbi:hypothetical protein DVH24_042141 [Malus domestica]|uniref:DUF7135 domain-containing protein n=1 Tax=Malus domestica TaxID=3750 RepID=A0A498IXY2_MALDO|nr:hypothetical protein DVH24_042141 [Malus domestica]